MSLDSFDQQVLEFSGNAQDMLKQFYNIDIGPATAPKYVTGIRHHLNFKESMPQDMGAKDMETLVVKADGSRTTTRMLMLSEEDSQDPHKVMKLMALDPLQWDLLSYKVRRNYWDTTIKNAEHEPEKSTNHAYMCTVTVKPIKGMLSEQSFITVFDNLQSPKIESYSYNPGEYMFELPLMDLHLAKLACQEETGQDYDLKIANKLYRHTVEDLREKIVPYEKSIEQIVFTIGQDFFHMDTTKNATTNGTLMDSDTRWYKMFSVGVEALIWSIDLLRQVAPVHALYVPGNHDLMLSYCAAKTVEAYFRNCEDVIVDVGPSSRKYVQYGANLIGFSHGKEGNRIEGLMQVEEPEKWAATKFREWHLGDLHHEMTKEVLGLIIRRIPAITAIDAWHGLKGFNAVRRASGYMWHKERGLEAIINSNVQIGDDMK